MEPSTENIRKWVEALRSGEYPQGQATLKDAGGNYCCLGVACEISGLGEWVEDPVAPNLRRKKYVVGDDESWSELPAPVAEWLGLDEDNPVLREDHFDVEEGDWVEITAISANDDLSYTFEQIADLIEATYLTVKV